MKYGIREICDVVLKAKSNQKIGNKIFYKDEPVLYFDTLKTSTMEGAATTVYAQGGRGNSRLVAWEGERTVTFTMEDALISPTGFAILSGAGLVEADKNNTIKVHTTEVAEVNKIIPKVTKVTDITSSFMGNNGNLDIEGVSKVYISFTILSDTKEGPVAPSIYSWYVGTDYDSDNDGEDNSPNYSVLITDNCIGESQFIKSQTYDESENTWYNSIEYEYVFPSMPEDFRSDFHSVVDCADGALDRLYNLQVIVEEEDNTAFDMIQMELNKQPYGKYIGSNAISHELIFINNDDGGKLVPIRFKEGQDYELIFHINDQDDAVKKGRFHVKMMDLNNEGETDTSSNIVIILNGKVNTNIISPEWFPKFGIQSFKDEKTGYIHVLFKAPVNYDTNKSLEYSIYLESYDNLPAGYTLAFDVIENGLINYYDASNVYVMKIENGEMISEPYIPTIIANSAIELNASRDDLDDVKVGDLFLVDYYTEVASGAQQIEITPDKFGGNYYLEATTLFRNQDGTDVPASFIIPNCKIQSNFNFTMASSGDPSTFTFTMDAFPDYLRFDKSKKVLAAIQLINDNKLDGSATRDRTKSNLKLK